jgi:hypothetical protein
MQIPGNTRPLKTRYHPSPYVVVNARHTTTQVKRLADGFESVYSNNDIKKYDKTSPLFASLPPQVARVLLHDFQNLLQQDLCTITKYDTLDGPAGMQLFDENLKEQSPESEEENEIDNPITITAEQNLVGDQIELDPLEEKLDSFPMQNSTLMDNIQINQIKESLKQKLDVPKQPDEVKLTPLTKDTTPKSANLKESKDTPKQSETQKNQNLENSDNSEDEIENQNLSNSNSAVSTKRKVTFDEKDT